MDYFFKNENHAWPLSLASKGFKHQTKKSDLTECLESLAPQPDNIPDVMLVLLILPPLCRYLTQVSSSKTFLDYLPIVFLPYIERLYRRKVVRVDVVWDV